MKALSHWPLIIGLALFAWLTYAAVSGGMERTGGTFIYPIDDTYIHMALARTWVQHGVWGLSPDRFGPAASSLAWFQLIGAAFAIIGQHDWAPFLLSTLFAAGVVVLAYLMFHRQRVAPVVGAVALCLLIAAAPLPTLAYSGMEHAAQVYINLAFLYLACRIAGADSGPLPKWKLAALLALAASVTAIRYEGMFLACVVCALLWWRRRARLAVLIAVAAALPVAAYAGYSLSHGGFFFPNPVLLKSANLDGRQSTLPLIGNLVERVTTQGHLGPLILAGLCLLLLLPMTAAERATRFGRDVLLVSVGVALLHLQFAAIGWLFRYEAYLVVMLLVGIVLAAAPLLPSWKAAVKMTRARVVPAACGVALAGILVTPLILRAIKAADETPRAAGNIYNQQYQMARFLARYYPGRAVVINDIGAIAWYADVKIIDRLGLDNMEIARLRLAEPPALTLDGLAAIARREGAPIAIVHEHYLPPGGADWVPVARWHIPDNVIGGDSSVTFLATSADDERRLRAALADFARELPPGVKASYLRSPPGIRVVQ